MCKHPLLLDVFTYYTFLYRKECQIIIKHLPLRGDISHTGVYTYLNEEVPEGEIYAYHNSHKEIKYRRLDSGEGEGGREGEREGGGEGGRGGGTEEGRDGGREGRRKGGTEGGREGGEREREREGGREGGEREREREGGREGRRGRGREGRGGGMDGGREGEREHEGITYTVL